VFASAAARDAAITSPQEGQCCYLKDTDAVLTYSGSAWVGFDDSNAIQNSIVDAKGDLVAASAADTPARLAVGSNGETLVADSAATTGLRYQGNYAAGKNKIINGDFGVWQRGTSFTLTNSVDTYTADRFIDFYIGTGTTTVSQQTFTPGTAPVAGYEGSYFKRAALSSGSTYYATQQKIEDVRTFAGQTVTFSFWAKATSSIGFTLYCRQNFGSGGSALVDTTTGITVSSSSWTRYSATISVPSISGKTIGTGSMVQFLLAQTSGTVASNTVDFWGFQVEAGSVATAFQTATGTIQGELAACQRYFQKSYDQATAPATASQISGMVFVPWAANVGNGSPFAWTKLHQTMRTTPTLTFYSYGGTAAKVSDNNNTDLAANSAFVTRAGESGFGLYNNSGGTINTGNNGFLFHWIGSAEL
jgi:hypothetical protein